MSETKKGVSKKKPDSGGREWLRCPQCDLRNLYYRKGVDNTFCRSCGAVLKVDFKLKTVTLLHR